MISRARFDEGTFKRCRRSSEEKRRGLREERVRGGGDLEVEYGYTLRPPASPEKLRTSKGLRMSNCFRESC